MKKICYHYLLQLLCFIKLTIAYDVSSTYNVAPVQFRLPTVVKPDHYLIKLDLTSIKNDRVVYGETCITINVTMPVNNLKLHAGQLIISEISLIDSNRSILLLNDYSIDENLKLLTVNFTDMIAMGKYNLTFKYIVDYTNDDDETDDSEFFIFNEMQTTKSRNIYPCWDEPEFKANFTIFIKHNSHYTALSNMNVEKIISDGINSTVQTTKFATTPKMSTYSLAIVVADIVHCKSNDGMIKVWSTADNIVKVEYTVKIIGDILEEMKNLTDIAYEDMGLIKLDIVALPQIYDTKGSWGLITVPEDLIVFDDNITDVAVKENSVNLLSRMCVQQWIGNLVSMGWWSDLWLYKGLIAYLEFFITEQITKSWRYFDHTVTNSRLSTLTLRNDESNAPSMKIGIVDPNYLHIGDTTLLYYKSVSIIYMISYVFGDVILRKAYKKFIQDHAFHSATSDDFINALTIVTDNSAIPIREILNNWISTSGYPIINVKRNYTAGKAIISQSRYLTNHSINEEYKTKYWVAINYATQDNVDFYNSTITNWLNPNELSIEIDGIKNDNWMILNKQWFGYYCVNYDMYNWKLIIKALKSNNYTDIHVVNRAGLLYDAMKLTLIEQLDYGTLISLIGYLEYETDLFPWIIMWEQIIFHIKKNLLTTKYYIPFQKYISQLPNKLIEKIGYFETDNDDHITKLYRHLAFDTACSWGTKSCVNKATEILTLWLKNPQKTIIPLDLRKTVLCSGVRGGNQEIFDSMMKLWILEKDFEILHALGCTINKTNVDILLSKTIDANTSHMIIHTIFHAISNDRVFGEDLVIDFAIKNWKSIDPNYRALVFHHITFFIIQKYQVDKIYNFLKSHPELDNHTRFVLNEDLTRMKYRFINSDIIIPELDIFFLNTI